MLLFGILLTHTRTLRHTLTHTHTHTHQRSAITGYLTVFPLFYLLYNSILHSFKMFKKKQKNFNCPKLGRQTLTRLNKLWTNMNVKYLNVALSPSTHAFRKLSVIKP